MWQKMLQHVVTRVIWSFPSQRRIRKESRVDSLIWTGVGTTFYSSTYMCISYYKIANYWCDHSGALSCPTKFHLFIRVLEVRSHKSHKRDGEYVPYSAFLCVNPVTQNVVFTQSPFREENSVVHKLTQYLISERNFGTNDGRFWFKV